MSDAGIWPWRSVDDLSVLFVEYSAQPIKALSVPQPVDQFLEDDLPLTENDGVYERGFQRLFREDGRVPASQYDREIRISLFYSLPYFDRIPDHRAGDQGDPEANCAF